MTAFHHLAIQVVNLQVAERFYCDVLGLRVIRRWPWPDGKVGERSLWLDLQPGFLALEACDGAVEPEPFRHPRPGLHLLSLAIAPGARAAWVEKLGVLIVHQTKYTLYVRDPEGNRVGLSHYPVEA